MDKLGVEYKIIDNISIARNDPYFGLYSTDDCVIPYLTINNARLLNKYFGLYLRETNLQYHVYSSLIGIDPSLFLNNDYVITTLFNFKKTYGDWYDNFQTAELFVRPDSGIKTFAATPILYQNCLSELRAISNGVSDESLICISSCKTFGDEIRFVVCDKHIVSGSRYATNSGNTIIEDQNISPELQSFAESVLKDMIWTPDDIFTLDVCQTDNGPKIVELNSFSCAGLYACDMEQVIIKVSEHTLNLYNEQFH